MVWNELAVLAFRNGDLDLAARWLQTAMQLVPKETGLMQRAALLHAALSSPWPSSRPRTLIRTDAASLTWSLADTHLAHPDADSGTQSPCNPNLTAG